VQEQTLKSITIVQEQSSKSLEKAMVHYGEQLIKVSQDCNQKITKVGEDVGVVKEDVKELQNQMSEMKTKSISANDGDVFLRFFPVLCDGSSWRCGWVPVYHSVGGVTYRLLVVCLAYLERYFSQECPVRKTPAETKAFFTTKLPLHDRLPYAHHQSVLAHCTPFTSNSTSATAGFGSSQAINRSKFVFLKFLPMKEKLQEVYRLMDDVPTTRVEDVDDKFVSYKMYGQTWKFTERSKRDTSTTPIRAFGSRNISPQLKKFMLAMDFSWTDKNYDQAKVDFFGIPPEWVGKRHVVCGRFDRNSAVVQTHDQQYPIGRGMAQESNLKKKGPEGRKRKRGN